MPSIYTIGSTSGRTWTTVAVFIAITVILLGYNLSFLDPQKVLLTSPFVIKLGHIIAGALWLVFLWIKKNTI